MAYDNAQMAQAWGDLLGLTPAQVTTLQAALDQWALGGARLTTWARLATDVNLFNDAAVAMVHDWYGGAANGGPNGDGLYPLMNSDAEVFLLPSPARVIADMASFEPKGALPSVDDLPTTGEPGDLWVIAGNAWGWNSRESAWKNVGPFQGPQGPAGVISDASISMLAPGAEPTVTLGGTPSDRTLAFSIPAARDGEDGVTPNASAEVTMIAAGQAAVVTRSGPDSAPVFTFQLPRSADGSDGREVELQTSATHIQWRYAGDAGWTDLVALSAITPEPVPGPAAWTPVIASVADGERRVWRIADWVGGSGAKPATGQYLGPTGLVETAAEATDVRGAGGSGSGDMIAANNLSDLTDKAAARTTLSVYSRAEADALLDDKQGALGFTPADAAAVATALEDKADLVGGKVPAAQLPEPPAVPTKATGAELRAGADDAKFLTPKSITDAAAYVTTPWAASLALDLSIPAQIVVLGGHTTLTAPTNVKPGVSARVLLKQPASGGPFTVSYNAAFAFFGPTPAASTAANAVDMLILDPETATKVSAVLQKGRAG